MNQAKHSTLYAAGNRITGATQTSAPQTAETIDSNINLILSDIDSNQRYPMNQAKKRGMSLKPKQGYQHHNFF